MNASALPWATSITAADSLSRTSTRACCRAVAAYWWPVVPFLTTTARPGVSRSAADWTDDLVATSMASPVFK